MRIGVIPDSGGTYFIPRILGWSRAFEWLASTEELSASRALEWGLVSEVVEPAELLERTVAKARQLAEMPGNAVGLTKVLLQQSWASTLSEQLEREAEAMPLALLAPGRAEARAAMVAKLAAESAGKD
jgi:2-(1,2-epoxy-1,2-dihydrophenyl)acetyl-CoA isomerase